MYINYKVWHKDDRSDERTLSGHDAWDVAALYALTYAETFGALPCGGLVVPCSLVVFAQSKGDEPHRITVDLKPVVTTSARVRCDERCRCFDYGPFVLDDLQSPRASTKLARED